MKTGLLRTPGRAAANHRACKDRYLARPVIIRRAESLSFGLGAVHQLPGSQMIQTSYARTWTVWLPNKLAKSIRSLKILCGFDQSASSWHLLARQDPFAHAASSRRLREQVEITCPIDNRGWGADICGMRQSFVRLFISIMMVLGVGAASLAHASGPCVPQMQSQELSPTVLSDCAQGFFRSENGTIPCGKMRAGCVTAASCFSNVGLAPTDVPFPIYRCSDANQGTMPITVLGGIRIAPLLQPPTPAS